MHKGAGNLRVRALRSHLDHDVVGYAQDSVDFLDGPLGGKLFRVGVHESPQRDHSVVGGHANIGGGYLRLPFQLPQYGVAQVLIGFLVLYGLHGNVSCTRWSTSRAMWESPLIRPL